MIEMQHSCLRLQKGEFPPWHFSSLLVLQLLTNECDKHSVPNIFNTSLVCDFASERKNQDYTHYPKVHVTTDRTSSKALYLFCLRFPPRAQN